jgi:thiamine-phosphate pyrophosphorylase
VIGLSTHSEEQIEAAGDVDYIAVGPVFRTPTKPDYEPIGVEVVRWAVDHTPVPFFAIGGIDRSNVDMVLAAGARRIAVVRAIRDAGDPGEAARELAERIANRDGVRTSG